MTHNSTSLTDLAGMGAAPGAPYLDFGARLYSPGTATWLSADPMAEKYYAIGPNVYCAGSPVNLVDPTGEDWFQNLMTGELYYNEDYTILDIGLGYMSDDIDNWAYLAKNDSFSIADQQLVSDYARPVWGGGFSFNPVSAETAMDLVGFGYKPLQATIEVTQQLYSYSEGQISILIPYTKERTVDILKSGYVPNNYYQRIKSTQYLGTLRRETDLLTPSTTSVWLETRSFSYSAHDNRANKAPIKDALFEVAKTLSGMFKIK